MPGVRPCSAASPAAICGRAARKIAPTPSASFCDTDFVGTDGENGGKYRTPADLVAMIASLWPEGEAHRFVVCTGGEPMLQIDQPFVDALHAAGFEIAIETNGSLPVLETIDWICVSPKADAPLVVTKGNELKVVVPQDNQRLADYAKLDFEYFLVQPMDGPSRDINTKLAIDWCKRHPQVAPVDADPQVPEHPLIQTTLSRRADDYPKTRIRRGPPHPRSPQPVP